MAETGTSLTLEETIAAQNAAADPACSAWVAANAGSGKTRVLTNRVARLLLAGADPAKILCITYTKAAAAEMADRLSVMLGEWALLADEPLRKTLADLTGKPGDAFDDAALSASRRLFARALETPGGLRIQTIHAFCSSVLRRFPVEAGVPPGFSEIEDAERDRLIDRALDLVVAEGGPQLQAAIGRLADRFGGDADAMVRDVLKSRLAYERARARFGDRAAMLAALADACGLDPDKDIEKLIADFFAEYDSATFLTLAEALRAGKKNANKCADVFEAVATTAGSMEKFDTLYTCLFTTGDTPRKTVADAGVKKAFPGPAQSIADLQADFVTLVEQWRNHNLYHGTADFYHVVDAALEAYAKQKLFAARLDFDDLIARTAYLFSASTGQAAWVLYKLDHGIEHILLDEAQDTSPDQWSVIEGPLTEFMAGSGASEQNRTFFAVGDQKQSIYSFQGADAGLFLEKENDLGTSLGAAGAFHSAPLRLSFRSTAAVLRCVDAIFDNQRVRDGLGNIDRLVHGVHRTGEAGLVEVWPVVPKPETAELAPWDAPLDRVAADSPVRTLCSHVAETIHGWLARGEILESKNRPIEPGDIIILVRKRGAPFREILKCLSQKGLPVAGADRLTLQSDIAVMDLISFARFALTHDDDLSLAEVLKSPLFGWDDDDLFAVAHDRDGKSLWQALRSDPVHDDLVARLASVSAIGRREGAYAFFSHILETGNPSGWKRFYARLGTTARDPIQALLKAALDDELDHPRSLDGFLSRFETQKIEIKRELNKVKGAIRVMTVHGAKGLEAPIIFLLDAHPDASIKVRQEVYYADMSGEDTRPAARANRPLLPIVDKKDRGSSPLFAVASEEQKVREYEEYRRQLYVALTRAEDRLYICGTAGRSPWNPDKASQNPETASWHLLATLGMQRLVETGEAEEVDFALPWEGRGYCVSSTQTKTAVSEHEKEDGSPAEPARPVWMDRPATPERAPVHLQPSRLAERFETMQTAPQKSVTPDLPVAVSPNSASLARLRGTAIHRVLEILPGTDPSVWPALAARLIARTAPEAADSDRAQWCDEALSVLGDPAFAPVFAPGSRAEVSIGGALPGLAGRVSGQIDRLVVTQDEVLIVDYKTNQPPPAHEADVATEYLVQMAAYRALLAQIYPEKPVKAALLWTYSACLMPLSADVLDHALSRLQDSA